MPIRTAGTASSKVVNKTTPAKITGGQYGSVGQQIAKMSGSDVMESLRRAGIVTKDGKLAAKYKKK
jgi:hypothetical protein